MEAILLILEYAAVFGLTIMWRMDIGSWWQYGIVMVLAILFKLGRYSDEKAKNIRREESLALSLLALWIPSLKARIIYAIFACYLMAIGEDFLENGGKDNNKHCFQQLFGGILLMQGTINIMFCIWPGDGSRLWNIVATVIMCIAGTCIMETVEEVQNYDEDQRAEDKKREERENRYYRSAFAKAMNDLTYDEVMNDQGLYGEYVTSTWLTDISYFYRPLFSVSVPEKSELGSTELDSIVVTAKGLYVIEVKNRALNWLVDESSDEAYCTDSHGRKTVEKNPFVQNAKHMRSLENFILHSGNEDAIEAFWTLGGNVMGYVVMGPSTLDWSVAQVEQGYCSYKSIGEMIDSSISDSIANYSDVKERERAAETLYRFLKKYENNHELKYKHDTILKIRDFKKRGMI